MSDAEYRQDSEVADLDPRLSYVIGICTRNRLDLLQRLVGSIRELRIPDSIDLEVIIVDNNDTRQVYEKDFDVPETVGLSVHHEAQPGLVYARNALFDIAELRGADWLLGIDDDEWLDTEWLVEWHRGTKNSGSGIMVGTTTFFFQDGLHPFHPRGQFPVPKEGKRPPILGTFNYAIHRSVFGRKSGLGMRFDLHFNKSGGEDLEFMLRAMRQHNVIVTGWPHAKAYEIRSSDRASMRYEIWRGIRNQVNAYTVAARHSELGITGYRHGVQIVVLRSIARNILFGTALLGLTLVKFIARRKDTGATFGQALRRFARASAFVPFKMGKIHQEYGN